MCPNGRCLTKNLVCDGLCDCISIEGEQCLDEVNCEKVYNRKNHFLNCSSSSLLCAAPKLNNSIYTGALTHSGKFRSFIELIKILKLKYFFSF